MTTTGLTRCHSMIILHEAAQPGAELRECGRNPKTSSILLLDKMVRDVNEVDFRYLYFSGSSFISPCPTTILRWNTGIYAGKFMRLCQLARLRLTHSR